ncbi:hypothetical protein IQ06DRAFT_280523 [Phaeosphaeriaceae sp. SRC1lsM3a]|nr:hypothetical protein IQ06DRAFT_280523 [Stagonospora sp. SRC1lsM3a]
MMELDKATTLAPAGDHSDSGVALEGFYSMDEFMAKVNAENAARNAATNTQPNPSNANRVTPQPGQGPVAVGARTSKYTVALHEKYQALGLQEPFFDYRGGSAYGWTGTLSFPGLDVDELQGIKVDKVYSGKQAVKEALSELALPILTRLVDEGVVKKMDAETRSRSSKYKVALHDKHQKLGLPQPFFDSKGSTMQGWISIVTFPGIEELKGVTLQTPASTRSKHEATEVVSKMAYELIETAEKEGKFASFAKVKGPAQQQAQEKKDPGPNYTGQLLVGATLFTCQITIDSNDSSPALVFGSLDSKFTSKKVARQEAARLAVEHFKALGTWPANTLPVGGIKKRKKASSSTAQDPFAPPSPSTSTAPPPQPSGSNSYAQQLQSLALALSLGTPEWRWTPNPLDRDFHTVACYFAGGGQHAGPIGEVRNVFGKKKAKEECARLTLEYLKEVRKERMRFAEEMLRGVGGGEQVVEAAVGREVEGEKEAVERRVGKGGVTEEDEMDVDGDDDVEFEDAVESLEVGK